ncbi:MAG: UDP-N-acetylmuramate dehydrogenase [Deltaproteobacteria bacterium]|nr:UDP-N-acetylmuramate dehydrogenase [Deltaproteobacteria bacterium]
MRTELRERLRSLLGERLRFAVPLLRYTSFRVGGPAEVFAEPDTLAELQALVALLHQESVPYFLLGGGTNILISDKGVGGVVIKLGEGFDYSRWEEQEDSARVRVGAARPLGRFVREAIAKGYGGVEFAEGIPGSLGGGLLMNAGAFGGELSRVVEAISGICPDGTLVRLPGEKLGFAYRRTALPPRLIVTEIEFHVQRQPQEVLTAAMREAQRKRQQTQPHGYPNAGSIFKNPPGTYAGRLIEAAGLKGLVRGGAQVSEQHANFIVNTGRASAAEVRQLMEQIQQTVWQKNHVWLEPEVRLVGEW